MVPATGASVNVGAGTGADTEGRRYRGRRAVPATASHVDRRHSGL